jgi:LmbE family N-acetylglucosaminyl deacetylase
MKKWIYLSPHFDDVVLSIGGMVWEQTHDGDHVEIWTLCAGDPAPGVQLPDYAKKLHALWNLGEDVPRKRSYEDAACCTILGADYRRFTIPDCIYRFLPDSKNPIVMKNEDIFSPLGPEETHLIPLAELVAPLAIGNHRDHWLTRKAAEGLDIPLWHYVDYPYVIQREYNLADWIPAENKKIKTKITPAGLKAWQNGIAQQKSQINLFWSDATKMREAIKDYFRLGYGYTIYQF